MAVSAHSPLRAGIAAFAAIVLVLSGTVGSTVLRPPAEHAVSTSANPARAFAVRLLAALQQMQHASATAADPSTTTSAAVAAKTPGGTGTQLKPSAATKAAATPAAATPTAVSFGLPGVQNAIIDGYNTVMPWVDWGVEVAQWAVGWVPWVGWVGADQIGIFYFDLIRPLITSAVYNTAYVIGGSVGFFPAIGNFINDTGNAINGFVHAEINWALGFLPPLPPLPFAATKAAAAKTDTKAAGAVAKPGATKTKAAEDTVAPADDSKTPDATAPDTKDSKDAKAQEQPTAETGQPSSTSPKSDTESQPADNVTKAGKDTGKSDKSTKTDSGAGKSAKNGKSGKHSGHSGKSGSADRGGHGHHSGRHGPK